MAIISPVAVYHTFKMDILALLGQETSILINWYKYAPCQFDRCWRIFLK